MYCPGAEVLFWVVCYVLSLLWFAILRVSSFIIESLCLEGLFVSWLLSVRCGARKICENSLSDYGGVLVICVKYYELNVRMFCTYFCLVFLCNLIFWLWCIQHLWHCVSSSLLTLSLDGGVNVHSNCSIHCSTVSLRVLCGTINC